MKVFGTRRNRSDGTVNPPRILHATNNPQKKPSFQIAVIRRNYRPPSSTRKRPESCITLVITSKTAEPKYDYESLEIRLTGIECRWLELALAQELGTRAVRGHARKARQLTRVEGRKRQI